MDEIHVTIMIEPEMRVTALADPTLAPCRPVAVWAEISSAMPLIDAWCRAGWRWREGGHVPAPQEGREHARKDLALDIPQRDIDAGNGKGRQADASAIHPRMRHQMCQMVSV